MKILVPRSVQESPPAHLAGGKGAQLFSLVRWGARVPDFLVVPASAHQWYERQGQLPQELLSEIAAEVQSWGVTGVSVRSSVTLEDGVDASFAGMFETFLYVAPEQINTKISEAYGAVGSERVKRYCMEKKIQGELTMALVIQAMVDPDASGVAFSRAPVGNSADVVIDAGYGVGEGIVAGLVETDHYRLSRLGELLECHTPPKLSRLVADPAGGTKGADVPPQDRDRPVLSPEQRQELLGTVLRMEESAGHPVDIEFAIKDQTLFLLQVRPITRDFPPLLYLADTNLSESYPGVTSPLTASFIQRAYAHVFLESAILLGARGAFVRALLRHYAKLISYVDHHLYYNLEHYYAALSALPGGKKNIENWHRMIGGKLAGTHIPFEELRPSFFRALRSAAKLLAFAFTQHRVLERFDESVQSNLKYQRAQRNDASDAREVAKVLTHLTARPHGFGLTALNDVLLMLGVKGLAHILKQRGFDESELPLLLKTEQEVESLKPLLELRTIVLELPAEFWPAWERLIQQSSIWDNPYTAIWDHLKGQGFAAEAVTLAGYLERYGERAFEELKLESVTFRQSPVAFAELLAFVKSTATSPRPPQAQAARFRSESLPLLTRLLWQRLFNLTKRSVFWRERTRLLRGQFYNAVRETIYRLAQVLRTDYPAFQTFDWKDFFNVSLEDYEAFARGDVDAGQLAELLESNRDWQRVTREHREFLIIGEGETSKAATESVAINQGADLLGQCASEGDVLGAPLVLNSPQEAFSKTDLRASILVTRHTDPAWVFIMANCKGLISEKGSLLSHTAIIGRELGIPTLVGVKDACLLLKDEKQIRLNASQGRIEVLRAENS